MLAPFWVGPGVVHLPWNFVFIECALEMLQDRQVWRRRIVEKWKRLMQRAAIFSEEGVQYYGLLRSDKRSGVN